jgi:hypothetical protein
LWSKSDLWSLSSSRKLLLGIVHSKDTNLSFSFHSTCDARKALDHFDGHQFQGLFLDVQVPEKFRCDLDHRVAQKFAQRRSSESRFGQSHGSFSTNHGSFSLNRQSLVHRDSKRRIRNTSSGTENTSARRNSIFTPQDARSDLPEFDQPILGVPETFHEAPPEAILEATSEEFNQSLRPTDNSEKSSSPSKKRAYKGKGKSRKSCGSHATPTEAGASSVATASLESM